jgi:tRNA pseudouridine65 synthase
VSAVDVTDALPILYQDDDVVVVDKPSDLLVHRTAVDGDNDAALQRVRDQIGQWLYPVHRLDRPTSGVLVFALSAVAAQRLGEAFRRNGVAKHYLAVVRGWPPQAGVIDRPLRPDKGKAARASRTRFARLATAELPIAVSRYPTARYALIMAAPDTGRYHQIRRHLNGISHPVVGDVARGDRHHNRFFREHFDSHRLLLHAWRLGFRHPASGDWQIVHAHPPAALESITGALGWCVGDRTLEAARLKLPSAGAPPAE